MTFRISKFPIVLALLVSVSTASFRAQDAKKAAADDEQSVKTNPTKSVPASTVKFRKELNLPYPSLGTLGSRIDAARRSGDPVALAHAASELAVAEKVSGKKASLTSSQVMKESAELASLRRQVAELKAVQNVSEKVLIAQEQLDSLKKMIDFAQTQTEADKKALLSKEEPTHAPRKIVVNNYSTQFIDIQVNGFLKGQVSPGTTKTFTIDEMWNPIVLKGYGDEDAQMWGPVELQGQFKSYTWNLNGDEGVPTRP